MCNHCIHLKWTGGGGPWDTRSRMDIEVAQPWSGPASFGPYSHWFRSRLYLQEWRHWRGPTPVGTGGRQNQDMVFHGKCRWCRTRKALLDRSRSVVTVHRIKTPFKREGEVGRAHAPSVLYTESEPPLKRKVRLVEYQSLLLASPAARPRESSNRTVCGTHAAQSAEG